MALAAIAFASVAQAEVSLQSARAYAGPVLQFFAGSHAAQPAAPSAQRRSAQHAKGGARETLASTAWLAMLPVFFVGLVAPLNKLSPGSLLWVGGMPSTPLLPASFQRPPPAQFA